MVRIHPDPPGAAIAQVASQSRRAGATCTEHVHELPSNEEWRSERGCSSIGRAPALQAGGRRFDPVQLHQSGVRSQLTVDSGADQAGGVQEVMVLLTPAN